MTSGVGEKFGYHPLWTEKSEVVSEHSAKSDFLSLQPSKDSLEAPASFDPRAENEPLSNTVTIDKGKHLSEEKLSMIQRMGDGLNSMTAFARKHPWLTAGMFAALLMFGATAYLTTNAFLGHTTLDIFNLHPDIGAGLSFMTLYYGVYLLNLCRRAALKDDLIAQVDLASNQLINVNQTRNKMNAKREKTEKQLEKELKSIKIEYETANALLKNYQSQFEKLLKYDLSEEENENIQLAASAIREGSELAFPESPFKLPSIPVLTESVIIPETEAIKDGKENARKARSMGEKFKHLAHNIETFTKENPGSAALILTGVAIFALGGVAAYFWFHGMSDMYFFGALSLTTIPPVLMYGISFAYEGYTSGNLNTLKRKLASFEQVNKQQQAVRTMLAAKKTFSSKLKSESEKYQRELEELKKKNVSGNRDVGVYKGILMPFLRKFPEIDPEAAERLFREPINWLQSR